MRLLFSISYYAPYISGLTIYAQRLAEELAKHYTVHILCWNHTGDLETRERLNGVDVVRAKPFLRLSKGFLGWDWFEQAYQCVRDSDVVFLHLPQPEAIVTALFARLEGKKVISIYHCELTIRNFFLQALVDFCHFLVLTMSQSIITYTEDYSRHSRLLPRFNSKVKTVYPLIPEQPIDKDVFNELKRQTRDSDFVIGVAARLAAEKGFEYLFEAIEQLKTLLHGHRFKILIAGPLSPVGERRYKEKIMRLAKANEASLLFLDSIPTAAMGSFYNTLNVLVLPSINSTEAFGMVQVEAMLAGVPVVASDLPGVRVPIQVTGMGRIVPPRNVEKLAQAIADVLLHPDTFVQNKKDILNIFSYQDTLHFYENLLTTVSG